MEKKENQRVRLTKRLLKDALIDLLENEVIQNVTITDVCAKAEINRTTFYKYYSNECALYDDIENDFIRLLKESLKDFDYETLEELFSVIQKNAKTSIVLINNSDEEKLLAKIFSLPEIANNIKFRRLEKSPYRDEMLFFICSGCLALVKKWVNSGFLLSPKELSDFMKNIVDKLMR